MFRVVVLWCVSLYAFGQQPSLEAVRIEEDIRVDGVLDEAAWQDAPAATKFTTLDPVPGQPAGQPSEVRVVYSNLGIYFGARDCNSVEAGLIGKYSFTASMTLNLIVRHY